MVFTVRGMSCQHCVAAIKAAAREVDPAAEAAVDLAAGRVEIRSGADAKAMRGAIEGAGYEAELVGA